MLISYQYQLNELDVISAKVPGREKARLDMFVNCFSDYGYCIFSIPVRIGIRPEIIGIRLSEEHDLVDWWSVSDTPLGAIVRY